MCKLELIMVLAHTINNGIIWQIRILLLKENNISAAM